jgi:imidazole glycerol-phosphate synthase subunit HisH
MIAIVDYGLGNTQALVNIYKRLNVPVTLASTPESLRAADRLVLPGVGAFDWAMQCLEQSGLRPALDEAVTVSKRPVLGICVGMQMMARTSEEGRDAGLCWVDAEVKRFRFESGAEQLSLPHMGWNDIDRASHCALLGKLEDHSRFYFLHSYYFAPRNKATVVATTDYGGSFACAVQSGNCYGVQFHPEKSHGWGIQLLKNFAEV